MLPPLFGSLHLLRVLPYGGFAPKALGQNFLGGCLLRWPEVEDICMNACGACDRADRLVPMHVVPVTELTIPMHAVPVTELTDLYLCMWCL